MKTKNLVLLLLIIVGLAGWWIYSEYESRKNISNCSFSLESFKVKSVFPELKLKMLIKVHNPTKRKAEIDSIDYEVYFPELVDYAIGKGNIKGVVVNPNDFAISEAILVVPLAESILPVVKALSKKNKLLRLDIKGNVYYGKNIVVPFAISQQVNLKN